ncbi:protein of unknown function [Georgfuchsia toluolica]|uniref:Uncharacterized protein n=1 Tax=Georgfuchsia toluolica TaxID=424218 RepID=A0A916J2X4_9PROT|nr:protein of unknown function [Georgfuchsia toluolica]
MTRETIEDYIAADEKRQEWADRKLFDFVSGALKSYNPNHETPREKVPTPFTICVGPTDIMRY